MEEPLTNANQAINLGVPWLLPDGGMMTLTVFDDIIRSSQGTTRKKG